MFIMNLVIICGVILIIDIFDKMVKDKGLGGIVGVFGKIGVVFEDNLKKIGVFVEEYLDDIFCFFDKVVKFLSIIDYVLFFEGLGKGIKGVKDDVVGLFNLLKFIFEFLGKGDILKGLGVFILWLFEFGVVLKFIVISVKGFFILFKVFGVFGKIKLFKFGKGGGVLEIVKLLESLKFIGIGFLKNVGNFVLLFGVIKVFEEGVEVMK